jgi:hypothetical protein
VWIIPMSTSTAEKILSHFQASTKSSTPRLSTSCSLSLIATLNLRISPWEIPFLLLLCFSSLWRLSSPRQRRLCLGHFPCLPSSPPSGLGGVASGDAMARAAPSGGRARRLQQALAQRGSASAGTGVARAPEQRRAGGPEQSSCERAQERLQAVGGSRRRGAGARVERQVRRRRAGCGRPRVQGSLRLRLGQVWQWRRCRSEAGMEAALVRAWCDDVRAEEGRPQHVWRWPRTHAA